MKAVIQRVTEASVRVEGALTGSIATGLLILLGIQSGDSEKEIEWMANKITRLRIFNDTEGKMNLSLEDIGASVMIVSQFTLLAETRKGNRPSYINAARPEEANILYNQFIDVFRHQLGINRVQTGQFGADMQVSLVNDGPVTIILDTC